MIQFLEKISFDLGLEFFAAVLGVLSVWFAKKNKVLVYPTGIISTLIYVWILFKNQLWRFNYQCIFFFNEYIWMVFLE